MRNKIIFPAIVIGIVSILLQSFVPWWSIAIIAFVVAGAFIDSPYKALAAGFLGIGISWLLVVIVKESGVNISAAQAIGDLLGGIPGYLSYVITGLIGGIIGGLGAMSGSFTRSIVLKP